MWQAANLTFTSVIPARGAQRRRAGIQGKRRTRSPGFRIALRASGM